MTLQVQKINESFSLITGDNQDLIQIADFYKVEREGAYFDPLVKRGFKSPYDYFTTATEYQGKKALIIMNGLLDLHNVLSELKPKETSGSFAKEEVLELLEDLEDILPFTHYDYQRKGIIDTLTGPTKTIGRYATGSGKSLIISTIVEFFRRKGMKGILLVPNINLLTQFHNDIEEYNLKELHEDTELIGGGRSVKNIDELTKTLTISTWQSMANFEGDLGELDFVIADECVHPETLIMTSEGLKEIQDLEEAEMILTVNEELNVTEYKPIEKVHKNLRHSASETMYEVMMEDGSTLRITGNHKVNTQRGWVRTDELTLEDSILSA